MQCKGKLLNLHSEIRDGNRSSSDIPYFFRASLRRICTQKSKTGTALRATYPISFVRVFDEFALRNQRRAPLFERHTLFLSCESSTNLHSEIKDGHRSSSDIPYFFRASLRRICTQKKIYIGRIGSIGILINIF